MADFLIFSEKPENVKLDENGHSKLYKDLQNCHL